MNSVEILDAQPPKSNRGGARPGAGRKPKGYVPPQAKIDHDDAQARLTSAKADKAELDYKVASGEYVARAAVRQASATALQALSQTMRSVRDNLERRGVSIDVADMVDETIESTLNDLADQFEEMSGELSE